MEKEVRWLVGLVFLKTCVVLAFIVWGPLDLVPDEAQYWTWSQHLDWGYYSKPPGIAWLIASSTYVLGNTLLGVKAVALVVGACLPLAVYQMARCAGLNQGPAVWAGVFMALSPAGFLASFLATTDGPFILFWTLAFSVLLAAVAQNRIPCYLWVGILVAVGALFKWPIYLLWVLVAVFLWWRPKYASRELPVGMSLSLLGLVPSLIWNVKHDWATFRHVGSTIAGGNGIPPPPNPLDFLGAQILLVSPLVFFALLLAFRRGVKETPPDSMLFLLIGVALLLSVYGGMAFMRKMQGNWAAFAFPWIFVLAATVLQERWRRWASLLSVTLAVAGVAFALISPRTPFYHALGWRNLGSALETAGFSPQQHFLAGEKYQEVSVLSFYSPAQCQALFFNLHGARHNQFCYWPNTMTENGFFVLIDRTEVAAQESRVLYYLEMLAPYFRDVSFEGWFSLDDRKKAGLFRCEGFLQHFPDDSTIF